MEEDKRRFLLNSIKIINKIVERVINCPLKLELKENNNVLKKIENRKCRIRK